MKHRILELGRRLRRDRWRRRLLIAWGTLPLLELLLFAADFRRFGLGVWAAEILGLWAIGLVHAALAPEDWRGSAAWPGTVALVLSLVYLSAELFGLAFGPATVALPLVALGLGAVGFLTVRLLDRLLWQRIPAVLLTLTGPVLLRLALIGPAQVVQPFLPAPSPTSDGPPLVVITIDTLRADFAEQMESWRFLRERGAVWPRAMSASAWTWPSLVTMWSGVPAEVHGSGREPGMKQTMRDWSAELPMLPTELREAGYVTAAFATNPVVALMPLSPLFGTWRHGNVIGPPLTLLGFPGPSSDAGDARNVVDAALRWLESAPDQGFLLWVHLSEPHLPYRHATEGTWDYNLLRNVRSGDWFMDAAARAAVRRAHLEEVAHVDAEVRRLLEALEARGLFERGAVLFTSDHGEEFWEHGGFEHGHSHHGEVIDVPLALVAPGVTPGPRADLASLQDVTPTLRAVAGLPGAGVDLRQPIPAGRVARAWGTTYYRPIHSYRVGTRRVIFEAERPPRAYDLAEDPEERSPLPVTDELRRALEEGAHDGDGGGDAPPALAPGPARALDEDLLRSLGYVH